MSPNTRKSRKRTQLYEPPEELRRLFPDVSGNAINGHNEPEVRQPSPIYWHRTAMEAHGDLQDWMVANFNRHPELENIYRNGDRGPRHLDPVAPHATQASAADLTQQLKAFALSHDADLIGITPYQQIWTFEGYPEIQEQWVVMLGVAMDHERLDTAPAVPSAQEVADKYNRGVRVAATVSNWIHSMGYPATTHGGPWAGPFNLIPAALACGFGELGKHGSIINRTYGSSFRLSAVLTDLPLVPDTPQRFGADDFCDRCRVCTDACPPDAIFDIKQLVRGEVKWYVDFDKCIPYFNETYGCGICIAACPWSTPGRAPKMAETWSKRMANNTSAGT